MFFTEVTDLFWGNIFLESVVQCLILVTQAQEPTLPKLQSAVAGSWAHGAALPGPCKQVSDITSAAMEQNPKQICPE